MYQQLSKEAQEIDDFMNILMNDDMQEATERGCQLAVYVNRTGNMLAQAKRLLDDALRTEIPNLIRQILPEKLSANVQNAMLSSVCAPERELVNKIEQLNKTAKYQLNFCITIISKIKEEMKYNNFQS